MTFRASRKRVCFSRLLAQTRKKWTSFENVLGSINSRGHSRRRVLCWEAFNLRFRDGEHSAPRGRRQQSVFQVRQDRSLEQGLRRTAR